MLTPRKIANQYRALISSIGFYPAIIITCLLLFSAVIASVEYTEIAMTLKQKLTWLFVEDNDSATTILSILAGGLISLTVFSFSMVMVVLNNAASTLSPRVLPGLITLKAHQYVLGLYLGSIVFTLVTLMNEHHVEGQFYPPAIGTFISLVLGLYSLALFVFFIHSISRSIQVDNVLNSLFKQTKQQIEGLISYQKEKQVKECPDYNQWYPVKSPQAGYFKGVQTSKMNALMDDHDLKLVVDVEPGFFCVKGFPFMYVNKDLSGDDELCEKIQQSCVFYIEEFIDDHYSYGVGQIAEIAIKALSPGINDPATAVKAIDMLSILFIKRLDVSDYGFSIYKDNTAPKLWFLEPSFHTLLVRHFDPIRHYGREDTTVLLNLVEALKNILFVCEGNGEHTQALYNYIHATVLDADRYIKNPYERLRINTMLARVNEVSMRRNDNRKYQLSVEDLTV